MFLTLRSFTPLLIIGLMALPATADVTMLSPAIPVTMVTRCNTPELAHEIMTAYSVSDEAGRAAVENRYDQITEFGKRLCNPVSNIPIFISQIEILEKTNIISLDGSTVPMRVAKVHLGLSSTDDHEIGFLVIPEEMAKLLVGEEM